MQAQPYYKLQYFNLLSQSWVDIQKAYHDKAAAVKALQDRANKDVRLVMIAGKSREVLSID